MGVRSKLIYKRQPWRKIWEFIWTQSSSFHSIWKGGSTKLRDCLDWWGDLLIILTVTLLFAALVWPVLEFGNCVWVPYLGKDKKLTESVLRRAAKVVDGLKDLSYEQCLKRVGLPSMGYLCLRGDIIETYKFTHCLYTTQDKLFTVDTKSVTRGHLYKPLWKPPFDILFLHKELLNIGTHCKQMSSMLSRIV